MKNIITVALVAATVLSLAACGDKTKKQTPEDSTSTTVIDSTTKTTTVIDSTKHDTVKVAEQKTPHKRSGNGSDPLNSASMRAMKDSIKKDSARMSRK
jgi:predicted small lipoprotein YifL